MLRKIPRIGHGLAKLYLWKPVYFNFAIVGAFGILLQYVVTWMLLTLGLPWWAAMFLGIVAAWNSNYILNKNWVFSND